MANYAVTDWNSGIGDIVAVLSAMETYLETIDSTKTIRASGVQNVGGSSFVAYVVHDA